MQEIFAPNIEPVQFSTTVFLAGSIDNNTAIMWQEEMVRHLSDMPVTFFNPRRPDWDPNWKQSGDNSKFREQVEWELNHLAAADIICFYFDPNGRAPIALLELGLHARGQNVVVCCPDDFWRQGNVEIVCERFGIQMVKSLAGLIDLVREKISDHHPKSKATTLP